eukprot:gene4084-14184_t
MAAHGLAGFKKGAQDISSSSLGPGRGSLARNSGSTQPLKYSASQDTSNLVLKAEASSDTKPQAQPDRSGFMTLESRLKRYHLNYLPRVSRERDQKPKSLRLVLYRTVPPASAVVMLACSPDAHAAKGPKYSPAVRAVLDYLKDHPMQLTSGTMMYYEPNQDLHTPLPAVADSLSPATVSQGCMKDSGFSLVVAGLLYLALGGLDHAHNLVTPLCWGSPTNYGGKPVRGSAAAKDAAYVHALVHRSEGFCEGEFGSGFSNANYWYGATGRHEIFPAVLEAACKLAAGTSRLEEIVARHGKEFDPYKFNSVCSQALSSKDQKLISFCSRVMEAEWNLLLEHSYTKMNKA